VGAALAPSPALATLPVAFYFVATMLTSIPAGLLMEKFGRKPALMASTLFGVTGALLTGASIMKNSFAGFMAGIAFIGIFNGFGNFFRFVAADSVDVAWKSKAVSRVMIGGIFAAFIGPNLAGYTRTMSGEAEFAGSYYSMLVLYILIAVVLFFVRLDEPLKPAGKTQTAVVRSLSQVMLQPGFLVALICGMLGFGVMTFVMTATPLAMQGHAHHFDDTSFVIQWHVLAMFLPSFFTGSLISRFGVIRVMEAGAILGLACVAINLTGASVSHFLLALVCLGLSWSFLFIGAMTLLTENYLPEEKNRAQSLNDCLVFSSVAVAALSAGALQNAVGWQMVNKGVIPLLLIILGSLWWLSMQRKKETVAHV
jgi:MFS family permease